MLGKAFSVALIILGLYILASFIFSIGQTETASSYHIGCYEADNSLDQVHVMQQYLFNVSQTLSPWSVAEVRRAQSIVEKKRVSPESANGVASEFKKYIIALQNIKKLNDYEQSYNKVVRDAQQDFLQCRKDFQAEDWDCKETYQRYLKSDENFTTIKGNLSDLIALKFREQSQIEKLLEPQGYNQGENQTYYKLMDELNRQLSDAWEQIKIYNETLFGYETRELRESHDLESYRKQLQECKNNMDQIGICQRITDEIKKIDYKLVPHDIQIKINGKRAIIQRYESALAKSIKVGVDTTFVREKLEENQRELSILLEMFGEAQTRGRCSDELIFKCSDQQMIQLQRNITSLKLSLNNTAILKETVRKDIEITSATIAEIEKKKDKATQDYQNSIGSLDKIKEIEATNLMKLKEHRDSINAYNHDITQMRGFFEEAESQRLKTIKEMDAILKRVGDLTGCLAKKDYLHQLQSKKPAKREEDVQLRRRAAEMLVRVIRQGYK